jgi:outer membrane protein assembly factor BamB
MKRCIGVVVALLLAVQLFLLERGLIDGTRFAGRAGLTVAIGLIAALFYLAAIAVAAGLWRTRPRTLGILIVVAAMLVSVRFHVPRLILKQRAAASRQHLIAAEQAPGLVSFLRNLAAAQEQHRLRVGAYAVSMEAVAPSAKVPSGAMVRIRAHADRGWTADVSHSGVTCSIWVRDSSLRGHAWQPEGSPTCGAAETRERREAIPTILVASASPSTGFQDSDIGGAWLQHRADARRSGAVASESPVAARWDARIEGSLRSSVTVAGNQVFVGAHGNGEFAALSLDSGKLGFRLRAPNWVHHEPAVTDSLVIVGFGNNELGASRETHTGTDPSGVVAYDRRTGFERWRVATKGSVMSTPVVMDSIVAVSTGGLEAVGIRVSDGAELWRTQMPGMVQMGNPLILDSLMLLGVEETNACSIDVRNGRMIYCRKLAACCWGAGHASAAVAGDLLILVFSNSVIEGNERIDGLSSLARRIIGIPSNARLPRSALAVAVGTDDGVERWRAPVGTGRIDPGGHIAGTPVITDSVAYITSIYDGNIVALDWRSGARLWLAPVRVSRGSVTVIGNSVLAASVDSAFVVLDARTGTRRCRQRLPARSDRAGLTIAGRTGILTLGNGTVMARPVDDWVRCRT